MLQFHHSLLIIFKSKKWKEKNVLFVLSYYHFVTVISLVCTVIEKMAPLTLNPHNSEYSKLNEKLHAPLESGFNWLQNHVDWIQE